MVDPLTSLLIAQHYKRPKSMRRQKAIEILGVSYISATQAMNKAREQICALRGVVQRSSESYPGRPG